MTGTSFIAGMNVRAMFVVHNPCLVGVSEKTGRLELVQRRCHGQRTRFVLKSSAAWGSGNPARRRWVYEQSKRQAQETIKKAEEVRRQREELARALEPRSSSPPPPPPTSIVRDVSHLEAARKIIEENRQSAQRAAEMAKAKGSASTTGTPAESRTAKQTGAATTSERSVAAQRAPSPVEASPSTRDTSSDGASAAPRPAGTAAASSSSGAAVADKSSDSAASSRSARSTPPSPGAATANKGSGSGASSAPASPAPESRGEQSAESETPGGPPGAKASATTDGPAKATQHQQQPDVSMEARNTSLGWDRSDLGRLNGKEFRSVSAVPDAPNAERFEFPKKVATSAEPTDERSTRPSATDWNVSTGSISSASPSSLRGAAVPTHTKIDSPASRSNISASGNSAVDSQLQEQTHSSATKEGFRMAGQATPAFAQSDAKQEHNKPDPIGLYAPPAAPLTDKGHDERVAPKGFGAYIRRIGREQNGMPENNVSSSLGGRREQHPEEEPPAGRPVHRGGESPVPRARLHTSRSPTMSSNSPPSAVTSGSRDSAEDLEHKVLHHLNTGKLAALTVPQLRAFLQQQKMPSTGKKKELIHEIERWWQAAHQQKH